MEQNRRKCSAVVTSAFGDNPRHMLKVFQRFDKNFSCHFQDKFALWVRGSCIQARQRVASWGVKGACAAPDISTFRVFLRLHIRYCCSVVSSLSASSFLNQDRLVHIYPRICLLRQRFPGSQTGTLKQQ